MRKLLKYLVLGVVVVGLMVITLTPAFAAKKQYRFVFLSAAIGHEFIQPLIRGMKDAAEALGSTADAVGPVEWDNDRTVAEGMAAIDAGIDGMVAQVGDPTTFAGISKRLKELGIPFVHTNISDETGQTLRDSYVGSSGVTQGEYMGKEMVKYLKPGDKVAFFFHMPHVQLKERLQGAQSVIREHGITWEEIVCGSELTKAISTVEAYLLGHPDIAGVYGVDGISTPSCALALKKRPDLQGKVRSGGFDLIPSVVEGVRDGYVDFTMDQMPYGYGFYPVVIMYLYLEYGITPPGQVETAVGAVDKSNVDAVLALVEAGYR